MNGVNGVGGGDDNYRGAGGESCRPRVIREDDMAEKLGLEWKWAGDAIDFHAASGMAKGVKGQVAVSEKEVKVSVDLPMMLRMMKGTIEDKIKEKLNAIG